MTKLATRLKSSSMLAAAALISSSIAMPANAAVTGRIFAGGGTFPEKVYRDVMNCFGAHSGTDTQTGLTTHVCNTGDAGFTAPYKAAQQLLYAGVGSGNGKKALINHDGGSLGLTSGGRIPDSVPVPSTADSGPYYGTGAGATYAGLKSTANPFPTISFIGSDDPLDPTDLVGAGKYLANAALVANHWGPAIQVPAAVGAIGLGYSPASGTWVENGVAPAAPVGAASAVSLTTNTWCGIMTGAINDWNNAEITADNGATSITGGASKTITVVYRSDGSGSTFLLVNALINQCAASTHPVPTSWQTASGNALGLSNNNWFINVNAAALLPANFIGQSGSGGIKTYVTSNPGSVGYASSDFLKPIDPTGMSAMNLQSYYTYSHGLAPVFIQPNMNSAGAIMASAVPPSSAAASCILNATYAKTTSYDGKCSHNPVNWGATNPTPAATTAFPIGGFTFMDMYSCYKTAGNGGLTGALKLVNTAAGKLGYMRWYFGTNAENGTKVKNALNAGGFGTIPAAWRTAVLNLIMTDKKTKIAGPGAANTACSIYTAGDTAGA